MFLAKSENRGVEEGGSVPSSWQIRRKKMNIETNQLVPSTHLAQFPGATWQLDPSQVRGG